MYQHVSEPERMAELHRLRVLDTPPDPLFDRTVAAMAAITGCPVALVSLVDTRRQWFKARYGMEATQTPRRQSFCSHAIRYKGPFEVRNAEMDRRFQSNPMVWGASHIRYYAGVPLTTARGARIGALCVIDNQPRKPLDDRIWRCLFSSSRTVVAAMEHMASLAA